MLEAANAHGHFEAGLPQAGGSEECRDRWSASMLFTWRSGTRRAQDFVKRRALAESFRIVSGLCPGQVDEDALPQPLTAPSLGR